MKKFGKVVVKLRIPILVLSFLLLIPACIGYLNTRVNYDILYYLPKDIDTMKGQDILLDDFGKGAYAMVVVDGMNKQNVSKLVKKVENVDHVAQVLINKVKSKCCGIKVKYNFTQLSQTHSNTNILPSNSQKSFHTKDIKQESTDIWQI